MSNKGVISWSGIGIRYLFALILVCTTYNPHYSFYHVIVQSENFFTAGKIFMAVVLVIGWAIFVRAMKRSLRLAGLILTVAFFGTFFWLLFEIGIINTKNPTVLTYIGLMLLAAILTTGISWSHIRRRLTGQVDVDEVEGGDHHDV